MIGSRLIVRLKGGLGNQLFCYATGKRLALNSGAELILDDTTGFIFDHVYKRKYALDKFNITARKTTSSERLEPFGRLRRLLLRRASQMRPLSQKRYILQNGVEFDEALLSLKLQPGYTFFDGFGQSELYFEDIEDTIRNDLEILPPVDKDYLELRDQIISCNAIALHVRWFDSENPLSLSNMSAAYYQRAIEFIKDRSPAPHFYIFTDNVDRTVELLDCHVTTCAHTFVSHKTASGNACSDMWLMSHCEHFIISNSTFAWWGAWLGERKGKSHIVAPAVKIDPTKNVTAWGFPHLLPERWTLL